MPYLSKRYILTILLGLGSLMHSLTCQTSQDEIKVSDISLDFIENRGQLPEPIRFKCGLDANTTVYLYDNSLRYVLFKEEKVEEIDHSDCDLDSRIPHDCDDTKHHHNHSHDKSVSGHAYEVKFLGANPGIELSGLNIKAYYLNFFLGDDPDNWQSEVPIFKGAQANDLYDGIALRAQSESGNFKYDLIVEPLADPGQIVMEYEGVDGLKLVGGDLIISTSINEIKELKPYAYQEYGGVRNQVACYYVLEENKVRFSFPEGYDRSRKLIIDPTVICSTLGGTVGGEIFGHTATYDGEGNIYLGGIAFAPGIPTTNGAFDESFNGGRTDIVVTKFNPIGTEAIYTTFVGGSNTDQPHSIIVDNKEQLCIFGISNSNNYPTTENAFQRNNGGLYDIVLTKLNTDGSALVGSTYVGGNQNDGGPSAWSSSFFFFTGDEFKGEVVMDNNDFIYVASLSRSTNFPVSLNALQPQLNPNGPNVQDAVIFRMTPDLSNLVWSTYFGGSGVDRAKGIRVERFGDVYVTGTAEANDMPKAPGGWMPDNPGGRSSAFIARIADSGRTLANFTFVGTDGIDDGFLLDLDKSGNVLMCGLSDGGMSATAGAYSSAPDAAQFISSFSTDLSKLNFTALVGTGQNRADFCPVAFMVDKCDFIYISGYETRSGLPTTPDAHLPNMTRQGFYLAVLEAGATDLSYGTYFGNASHVDGGTSRFDPAGVVTQGVCSCTSAGLLETTPGAFREQQQARCDMGVFKIDFDRDVVTSSITSFQSSTGCPPYTFNFEYSGQDATTFQWDLGDGSTDTSSTFSHTYIFPGRYQVRLIASNPNTCNLSDTTYYRIAVLGNTTVREANLCDPVKPIFLDVTAEDAVYRWNNGFTGSTLMVDEPGTYYVDISINGCGQRDSFVVRPPIPHSFSIGEDTTICQDPEILLGVPENDNHKYRWNTGQTSPDLLVTESGTYALTVINEDDCPLTDTVIVDFLQLPKPDLGPDALLCEGDSLVLDVSAFGTSYLWQDGSTDAQLTAETGGTYIVDVIESVCTLSDTIEIIGSNLSVLLPQDTVICDEPEYTIVPVSVDAEEYLWSTQEVSSSIIATQNGEYEVIVTDTSGCQSSDTIRVDFKLSPEVNLPSDTAFCTNELLTINLPTGPYTHQWEDGSTDLNYEVTAAGTYAVTSTQEECSTINVINVVENPVPPLELGVDQTYCNEDVVFLELPSTQTYEDIQWSDNSNGNSLEVNMDGLYWVQVENEFGCSVRDSITITLLYTADFTQEDITRCEDEDVSLDLSMIQGLDISWSDGSIGPAFTTSDFGEFWLELNNDGCIKRDSFRINVATLSDLTFDLEDVNCYGICDGAATLIATADVQSISWDLFGAETQLDGLCAGDYALIAQDTFGCTYERMITIAEPEEIIYELENSICFDSLEGYIQLQNVQGGIDPYQYTLNGESAEELMYGLPSGVYQIEIVDDNGCVKTETVNLEAPANFYLDAGQDQSIIIGEVTELDAELDGINPASVTWIPSAGVDCDTCLQTTITPSESSTYTLEIVDMDSDCVYRDLVHIEVESDMRIYYPNIINTNGSGDNAFFTIFGNRLVEQVDYLSIYDSWGNIIYEAENLPVNQPELGWDGTLRSGNAEQGVYTFSVAIRSKSGIVENLVGTITLIR